MSEARAPGKLVICGEYAVLHGAAAIAVAVNVAARAKVVRGGEASRLVIPDTGAWPCDWRPGEAPRWPTLPPAGHGEVLEAVAVTLAGRGWLPASLPALEITLDTREFYARLPDGSRQKLGLGSSAAITVALAGALLNELGVRPSRAELLSVCLESHRRLQGTAGSGVDVAVALHGGVVKLTTAGGNTEVSELAWLQGLHWLAIWSGAGVSTPQMLARFAAYRDREPARFAAWIERLHAAAERTAVAWESAEVNATLMALAEYDAALRWLDEDARIGIYTPVHERLAAAARLQGVVYKPSGAGGGDFGIAFAASPEPLERLRVQMAQEGFHTFSGGRGAPGLRHA
jgi:mevalonate kinase